MSRIFLVLLWVVSASAGEPLWEGGKVRATLIAPKLKSPVDKLVESTINGYLEEGFGRKLPVEKAADKGGTYVVVGNAQNNSVLARLVKAGLKLDASGAGGEGFRILTHEAGDKRFVIVTGNSPAGLKHGCQELVFFRLSATSERGDLDWPLDVTMKPAFPYRGIYMLPCWSAYDSIENWRAVLKFNSELTLNRSFFWLAGFPLLKDFGGEYTNSPLADVENVRGLVNLCREEDTKFYIGGGWFNWHHAKVIGGSIERGIQYYEELAKLLPGVEGIYLEPVGEGEDIAPKVWREHVGALKTLEAHLHKKDPKFEFAIAIGKFNAPAYREAIHQIDGRHTYWYWGWGDPTKQDALAEHPLVLRWHTIVRMSDFHGSTASPQPEEKALTGFVTSYDPGQGYGNPWNGWGKLGWDKPRDFHPHTMPYFSHEYRFREGCWNPEITESQFNARLSRRLFDADMPPESMANYKLLASFCFKPKEANEEAIRGLSDYVEAYKEHGSTRNRDTIARMSEALRGLKKTVASGTNSIQPQKQ